MTVSDEQIRQQLQLGEDNNWEFKRIEFKGTNPTSPKRSDLADELTAFANADGGILLLGVDDDGSMQGMSRTQLTSVDRLLSELCSDAIEPALRIKIHHRKIDDKAFLLVTVPRGDSVHERSGRAYIRVGSSKRLLLRDESLRLAQHRAQSRYFWFDRQVVPETGIETLSERLWEPLLSAEGATDPLRGLLALGLMARDEAEAFRATVAGILLCTPSPHDWLPQAIITATHYRGEDRATPQLDSQEITGPLPTQIADAVQFVVRNMRVAARKTPEREDIPQYNKAAVFEALVNAVAHRDYSMSTRKIRLSMFKDRLEIDSPGPLPNGMTIEGMESSQATRNETLASVFGRMPVGKISGSGHRRFLMEKRGDGVAIIRKETLEATGLLPEYQLINESALTLRIPAATLKLVPADATVTILSKGKPLADVDVLALFPNKTWVRETTNEYGEAMFDLYTTNLPMIVYAASPRFHSGIARDWVPNRGGLLLDLDPLPSGGAAIIAESRGRIPRVNGTLNPIRDAYDRTYLFADNIAIDEGRQQPVPIRLGKPYRLTDPQGVNTSITVVDITGKSSLIEYRPFEK